MPSDSAIVIASYCQAYFVLAWAVADARRRQRTPCFDFGMLALLIFPFSVIWYALWSRGFWGFLPLLALLGLYLLPWVCAALAVAVAIAGR